MTGGCGSSSSMELRASHGERLCRGERVDCLTEAYRCFRTGSCPSWSAAEVAGVIFSRVCGLLPDEDGESNDNNVEQICISVSLVERISSSLTSRGFTAAAQSYSEEVMRVMFQDMDLMSQLVHQFQSEDQIISHLAAKSVSACVLYYLQTSGTISPVWRRTCLQAFHSSLPGTQLDACLWSLTELLKNLFKGAHQETFGKLLAALDSGLSSLCAKFLPDDSQEVTQCLVGFPSSRPWGTTFCLLLDLLEVLTASSLTWGPAACLRSQRITHTHSSALLATISGSSEYFVKKRAVLLLKRAVFQKAGEDWASGEVLLTELKHEHFRSDMSILARSVLTAVAADWLQAVQVESASFFGGTRAIRRDGGQKPDCVMLRSVSLLLLKSAELHIQTAGGAAGARSSGTEVYGYLQSLWSFLRRCSVQLTEVTHRCCWVSLLFGDQDDDMMEAAKASLSIFLHHRRCSGLDHSAVLEAACASGNNPHCIFLLLLQSISFDHSILLDFLISTETCFLEFLVRYLKYLTADWQGFTAACGKISGSDCHLSSQQSSPASCGGDVLTLTVKGEPRLVQYGSSSESDPEDMEVSQHEQGTSVYVTGTLSAVDVPQGPIRHKQCESSHLLLEADSALKGRPEGLSPPVLHSEQTGVNMTAVSGQVSCETSARAVLCLSQLREVVTRLQAKKLFPYTPSSLLKLLAQVENCPLSHFNKT